MHTSYREIHITAHDTQRSNSQQMQYPLETWGMISGVTGRLADSCCGLMVESGQRRWLAWFVLRSCWAVDQFYCLHTGRDQCRLCFLWTFVWEWMFVCVHGYGPQLRYLLVSFECACRLGLLCTYLMSFYTIINTLCMDVCVTVCDSPPLAKAFSSTLSLDCSITSLIHWCVFFITLTRQRKKISLSQRCFIGILYAIYSATMLIIYWPLFWKSFSTKYFVIDT